MTAPNRNTLWARIIVDELVKGGLETLVVAPGSRSTPLTMAAAANDGVETVSHLDERSAGFFALGQAKRRGRPTAVVTTSGTATANLHPAVIEAHQSRTPLLVLTADRPPELWDSGANQTIDQTELYGRAPRFARTLPEPEPEPRKLRSLRTTISRAVVAATGVNPGPVHLNVPFRKPLEPVDVPGDIPADLDESDPLAVHGREGPFVEVSPGDVHPNEPTLNRVVEAIESAERGLIVAGPLGCGDGTVQGIRDIAMATGFPVLADPLSGLRFGVPVDDTAVIGGYDGYLGSDAVAQWPTPDVVLRFGAAPTSKALRHYLMGVDTRQFVVDPVGGWREATFTATDLVEAEIEALADPLSDRIDRAANPSWHARFEDAERIHWDAVESADEADWEGWIARDIVELAAEPSTIFVSNSMPVRDLDRFAAPSPAQLTVLGNRGASGIDGIVSTGLGAGSVTDDQLVLVTGDLAYFHDMNGLLALGRVGLEATIVLVNNDGGGIFHMLPIEDFDPPFEDQFVTPHGLDFSPTAELYDLEFATVETPGAFETVFTSSQERSGTQVIEVRTDAETSHRTRERIESSVADGLPR